MAASGNINPLAFYDPGLYAQQQALTRKQALAAALLSASPAQGAYGGLASAGKNILGAYLAKTTDKDLQNMYGAGDTPATPPAPPQPSPQISNTAGANSSGVITSQPLAPLPGAPDSSGTPSPQALAGAMSGNSGQGAAPSAGAVSPPVPASGPAPPMQQGGQLLMGDAKPSDYAALNPAMRHLYDSIPHVRGLTAREAVVMQMTDPDNYNKALLAQGAPTDQMKNVAALYGYDSPEYRAMLGGILDKSASDNLRPGGGSLNHATNQITTMPNTNGVQVTFPQGAGGPAQMGLVQGAGPALAGSAYAGAAGKNAAEPWVGFDQSGMPQPTNKLAMTGAPNVLGLPGQGQQQGQPAPQPMPAPPQGGQMQPPPSQAAPAPSLRMQNPAGVIGGILGVPVTITSGNRTPQRNAAVGGVPNSAHLAPQNAYDFVPHGMSTAQASALMVQSGVPYDQIIDEGTHVHVSFAPTSRRQAFTRQQQGQPQSAPAASPQGGASPLMPALPANQAPYMQAMGKDAADRHDATVSAAAESPVRINVLDNIIRLSQGGVATGPGQEWQNSVMGYLANTPGIGKMFGGAKDGISNFQELQKFMYQNALRNWTAAGGTGTDAQMEAMQRANPNDHLFPMALQQIAQWGKASELAIQGKANAQDRFLQQNGQTPTNQNLFENTWRNAFDPKVFQYSIMSPADRAALARSYTPAQAQAFMQKQQQLRALGAIQ